METISLFEVGESGSGRVEEEIIIAQGAEGVGITGLNHYNLYISLMTIFESAAVWRLLLRELHTERYIPFKIPFVHPAICSPRGLTRKKSLSSNIGLARLRLSTMALSHFHRLRFNVSGVPRVLSFLGNSANCSLNIANASSFGRLLILSTSKAGPTFHSKGLIRSGFLGLGGGGRGASSGKSCSHREPKKGLDFLSGRGGRGTGASAAGDGSSTSRRISAASLSKGRRFKGRLNVGVEEPGFIRRTNGLLVVFFSVG